MTVALDYHANIDGHLITLADAVFGYHFSPHTDIAVTGERAALCMVRMIREGIRPAMALRKPGVMVPSIFSATGIEPLAQSSESRLPWRGLAPTSPTSPCSPGSRMRTCRIGA